MLNKKLKLAAERRSLKHSSDLAVVSTVPPQFDPYKVVQKQTIVDDNIFETFYPISSITDATSPIHFSIPGNNLWVALSNSYFVVKTKWVGEYTAAAASGAQAPAPEPAATTNNVGPVNNIGHALFESIQLTLNNTKIAYVQHYPYVAYLDKLLDHNRDHQTTIGQTSGWLKDEPGTTNFNKIPTQRTDLIIKRKKLGTTFIITPFVPFFFPGDEHIMPQVDIRITFDRKNSPKFYLMYEAARMTTAYDLQIESMTFHVPRFKTRSSFTVGLNSTLALQHIPAKAETTYGSIITKQINAGSTGYNLRDVFQGYVPQHIILAFVSSKGFNGDPTANPFYLQNFGIQSININVNGSPRPRPSETIDFTNNSNFITTYFNSLRTLEGANNAVPDITLSEFKDGYTFFAYDMTPSFLSGAGVELSKTERGVVSLEIKFSGALGEEVMMIIYALRNLKTFTDVTRTVTVEDSW